MLLLLLLELELLLLQGAEHFPGRRHVHVALCASRKQPRGKQKQHVLLEGKNRYAIHYHGCALNLGLAVPSLLSPMIKPTHAQRIRFPRGQSVLVADGCSVVERGGKKKQGQTKRP